MFQGPRRLDAHGQPFEGPKHGPAGKFHNAPRATQRRGLPDAGSLGSQPFRKRS